MQHIESGYSFSPFIEGENSSMRSEQMNLRSIWLVCQWQ
jgi:hypothetical protein